MKCDKCHGSGEVPDGVPEWIVNLGGPDVPYPLLRAFAEAFWAHVEEKAQAVAFRYANDDPPVSIKTLVREEFLK